MMLLTIVDLEMNQPSGNIIQIGSCVLDVRNQTISNNFQVLVQLPPGEELDPFITSLTGITQPEIDRQGVPLKKALEKYWEVNPGKHHGAWGWDHRELVELSDKLEVKHPMIHGYDIKAISALMACARPQGKLRSGLSNSLAREGLRFIGTPHRAFDDAYNTARLAASYVRKMKAFLVAEDAIRHSGENE